MRNGINAWAYLNKDSKPIAAELWAIMGWEPWQIDHLFRNGEQGALYDPATLTSLFQERTGAAATTPSVVGGVVGTLRDLSGNDNHATAPSDAARPLLGREPVGGVRNRLLNTDTLSTQSLTVTAVAHTLSFTGTGTITLSGASTAGPLVGTGASNRVSLTFTPSAASLTLTVSGSVTLAQLEIGSTATAYQKVGESSLDVTEVGKRTLYYLFFNGENNELRLNNPAISGHLVVAAGAVWRSMTVNSSRLFSTTRSTTAAAMAAVTDGTSNQVLARMRLADATLLLSSSNSVLDKTVVVARFFRGESGASVRLDANNSVFEEVSGVAQDPAFSTTEDYYIGSGRGILFAPLNVYFLVFRGAETASISGLKKYIAQKLGVTL